jgi:hypothetical protein
MVRPKDLPIVSRQDTWAGNTIIVLLAHLLVRVAVLVHVRLSRTHTGFEPVHDDLMNMNNGLLMCCRCQAQMPEATMLIIKNAQR